MRWNTTTPIRGRSTDVRPIGERRRDWEQVVRHPIDEGMWAYAARLYDTDVVTYLPNGDIIINANGWNTPSTAEFIHQYSPFICVKRHNNLWVHARTSNEHPSVSVKAYPLGNGPMRFNHKGGNLYEPAEKVVIKKKVVNRVLAKQAREPLMPFLAWAKTFLTLSDGWVMHETMKAGLGWEQREEDGPMMFPLAIRSESGLYEALTVQAEIEPEHTYLRVLCCMALRDYYDSEMVATHKWHGQSGIPYMQKFHNYRMEYETIKRKVYRWVETFEHVHEVIEVEPEGNAMRNLA